jgi:GNAT superfamily N-acetyltransferase
MSSPPTTRRLADLSRSELVELYEQVLRPAFRSEELLGLEEVVEGYTGSDAPPNGVLMRDGRPLAVLLTEWYVDRRVLLLSYLAVSEKSRGRGIGSVLADHVAGQVRDMKPPPVALAEVDDPRVWPGDEGTGDAEARLRFYARRGARLVPVSYFQPSLRGPGQRVPGMFLIQLDGTGDVSRELLAQFLQEYFTVCEGPESLADPDVVGLLHEVDALDAHPILPQLTEWRTIPPPT